MRLAVGATVLAAAGLLAAGCSTGQPAPTVTVTRTVAPRLSVHAKPKVIIRYRTRTVTHDVPEPAQGGPPTPSVNGATWAITIDSCTAMQCTAYPGAGPFGSTCGAVVNNQQVCVGGPGPP